MKKSANLHAGNRKCKKYWDFCLNSSNIIHNTLLTKSPRGLLGLDIARDYVKISYIDIA